MKKVKFGELTVRKLAGFCSQYTDCRGCPLIDDAVTVECLIARDAMGVHLEVEIDLPDEEVEK